MRVLARLEDNRAEAVLRAVKQNSVPESMRPPSPKSSPSASVNSLPRDARSQRWSQCLLMGTFRTCHDVRLESAKRSKADLPHSPIAIYEYTPSLRVKDSWEFPGELP
jgi:hypothetical protein